MSQDNREKPFSDGPFLFDEVEAPPGDLDATTFDKTVIADKRSQRISFPFFQWKSFILFIVCCCGIVFQWMYTSQLFHVPRDVAKTRILFNKAKERYTQQAAYWDMKLVQCVAAVQNEDAGQSNHVPIPHVSNHQAQNQQALFQNLQAFSPELWIAYLVNKAGFSLSRLDHLVIFPGEQGGDGNTIILSKYEPGIWPLKILLSLELAVKADFRAVSIDVLRIRRGGQDIALGMSWAYFGSELESLQRL